MGIAWCNELAYTGETEVTRPLSCPPSSGKNRVLRLQPTDFRFSIRREDVLRWIYLARITLAAGILVAALVVWPSAEPAQTFTATILFVIALGLTGLSVWHTHFLKRKPTDNFVYLQVIFDALIVTAIVHITGGADSPFAFLYILVISSGALLLPLPGGVLVGVLATILFLADAIWLQLGGCSHRPPGG